MGFKKYASVFLVLILSVELAVSQTTSEFNAILEQGTEAAARGDFEEAFDDWLTARESNFNATDPRIGIAFIQLASKHQQTARYEQASQMYSWGLSNVDDPQFAEELDQELKRIAPLVPGKDIRHLRGLLKEQKYRQVGKAINDLWEWMDPTASTAYNERLIEHWERIAYAQEHFTRGSYTVYGTDERAMIHIKYGQPNLIREGTVTYRPDLVRNWIEMAKECTLKEYEVRSKFKYPDYEIWKYRDIKTSTGRNLIYIFGDNGETGEFRMIDSLEDMIPQKAFQSYAYPSSFFLQLLFYHELSSVDPYFGESFDEMEMRLFRTSMRINRANFISEQESKSYRRQNAIKLSQIQLHVPNHTSGLHEEVPAIPVDVRQYRLLNDNGEPYLATVLLSNPYEVYFFDQGRESIPNVSAYELVGSAIGTDADKVIRYREQSSPAGLSELEGYGGQISKMKPEQVYLEVPYDSTVVNQKLTVELQNRQTDAKINQEGISQKYIRDVGNVQVQQAEPLPTDPGQLIMGDLIVGARHPRADNGTPFGFRVSPDASIPRGKNMFVHFEVYHLGLDNNSGDLNKFQLEYVVSKKGGILKGLFGNNPKVELALNYETTNTNFNENLEIDTSPFDPGNYTLELTAIEPGTDRKVGQTIAFTIEEPTADPLQGR